MERQDLEFVCEQCVWVPCDDRVHNKGKGGGKYQWYKCTECGKKQRRAVKSRKQSVKS